MAISVGLGPQYAAETAWIIQTQSAVSGKCQLDMIVF
jgi:hypothetical protein